jgi:D-alanyl-D-alanine carboxypeptidase
MKEFIHKHVISKPLVSTVIGLVVIVIAVFGVSIFIISNNVSGLKKEVASLTQNLNSRVLNLEAGLATSTLTSQELAQRLQAEQDKSAEFEESISDISGTVNTLEKLSKTDRELLQKYSKVYFLSDNYVPLRLKNIPEEYLYDKAITLQFHASVLSNLEDMLDEASTDDVTLKIASAYRSFSSQAGLKTGYLITYGSGANQFSADQGYSEHQLGTTIDLTTDTQVGALTVSFEKTQAYEWLSQNAYKYGFILSYPKGNAYYQYEPWHWRFVGVKLATYLHNEGINFSDMDQRDIDKYLVKIFD